MKKITLCVLMMVLLANRLFAVVVTTIEQLDTLAEQNGGFSFSVMGDNNGYEAWQYTRPDGGTPDPYALGMSHLQPWVEAHDKFCLGVGDHAIGTRKYWYRMNETNQFWHNHFYPSLGDNCNGTDYFYGVTADQAVWGRGWVMFKALNNFFTRSNATEQIVFRQPDTNSPVYSSISKADPDTLVPYPDQLCDYYARRIQGSFTFHIISVNVPDPGVLAERSKNFMMNKLYELAATKTDHDIIIVLAQKNHWLQRAESKGWMSRTERDSLMLIADLTVNGDDHIYRRQSEFDADYDRTEALWMNSGMPCSTTGSGRGYLNFHVFDNPPRFTVQYILTDPPTRALHVNAYQIGTTQRGLPAECTKPYLKYINGPYVSVDWNNFPIEPLANDAAFVSQSVPASLEPGETATVSITMKNMGTNIWSSSSGHQLGSQNPQENTLWIGTNRISLSQSVPAWTNHTFSFDITAPDEPGTYNFQWKMVEDTGPDSVWFGSVTPNVSINVRSIDPVQHGDALLAVDLHQNSTDPVPATPDYFIGWMIGNVDAGVAAPSTNINGYVLTVGSGTSTACLTTPSSQRGMNARNRSTGYIPNAGLFTQADLMRERIASLDNPIDPSSGNGTGNGLYLKISGLEPNTPYVLQAWGVDSTGTNPNATLKNGYNYGFDATRETAGYSSLPLLGNYTVSGSPAVITDNNQYSIMGTITATASGLIIYKQISSIDKSVMNGFVLYSAAPPEPSGYAAWAATNSIGAANEDEDDDGRNNFYEYALGGNPNDSLDTGTDPSLVNTEAGFDYIYLRRNDDPSLIYTVQVRTNLISGVWTIASGTVQTNVPGGAYDEVIHRIPADEPKSYVRLMITDQ